MELVWQTNGFQECQPDLYSEMKITDSLCSFLCNLAVTGNLQPRAKTLSLKRRGRERFLFSVKRSMITAFTLGFSLKWPGRDFSKSPLCIFFSFSFLDVIHRKIINSYYIRNLRCKLSLLENWMTSVCIFLDQNNFARAGCFLFLALHLPFTLLLFQLISKRPSELKKA